MTYVTADWRVNARIYRDPDIFEEEMERIFGRSWVYVAHESEIPTAGDYKLAYVGTQEVVVTRGLEDGRVNVMFNRCRHRGAAVCQRETGTANVFRCSYHGWTYNSSGALLGVPFPGAYGDRFDKSVMGLVHLSRVASYRGFIFASLTPDVPDLTEYLGHARKYLDYIANLAPGGVELSARAQKLVYRGNWKLQLENTIDPYHFSITHQTWLDILKARTGKASPWVANVRGNPEWRGIDLGNGHAVHEYGPLDQGPDAHGISIGELVPFNLNVFPSLAFVGAHLRLVVPRGPAESWVYLYPMFPKGADQETRDRILRDHEIFYGPAGFGSTDDIEVAFDRVTTGLQNTATPQDWILMSRGLEQETRDPQTGCRVGRSSDEVPQRAYLRRWLELMGATCGNE